MQRETKFKLKIRPLLDAIPHSFWIKIQMVALRGVPDFLGCINGIFIALELKADDGEDATPLQGYVIRKIIKAGGMGFVVTPALWPDIYAALLELSKASRIHLPKKGYLEKMH